jgi:hypothetical protein
LSQTHTNHPTFRWQHAEQQTMKFMQTPHSLEFVSSLEMKYQNIYGSVNGCSEICLSGITNPWDTCISANAFPAKRTWNWRIARSKNRTTITN